MGLQGAIEIGGKVGKLCGDGGEVRSGEDDGEAFGADKIAVEIVDGKVGTGGDFAAQFVEVGWGEGVGLEGVVGHYDKLAGAGQIQSIGVSVRGCTKPRR